ncbi:hypothetical protein DKX38_010838 [Salix brachista]|uniref:Nucleoplasmin-like domain-containing protein n=1 Tax=Salix brachista TaxID=2182728 RepID=A0A5N5LXT8_9ROSI|nr:hypothetical protein DKX38_010838 [Salix brachista]
MKMNLSSSITKPALFNTTNIFSSLNDGKLPSTTFKTPLSMSPHRHKTTATQILKTSFKANSSIANAEVPVEVEVAEGYSMTQFCDKVIDVFLNEKPRVKEWRKYLVFREEWNKYKESFYTRCKTRADRETDPTMKQRLISLASNVNKIDEAMEKHDELLKEIQDNPTDLDAIVAKRRKDFTGDFFRFLALLSETYDNLEDRDGVARLVAKCMSAVSAFDKTLESLETLDAAQAKFDDILNSSSVDAACEKIKSLAKAKELDSSLILLINSAWATAKESTSVKNEVKDIMYSLYKAMKRSLRSISPKEIKLLKHLLNIADPEERFSALATAFSPGDDHEAKDPYALYTTPKELHKWIKIMLDAYHLNKEDTDIKEARKMSQPVIIQRLFILKETIEEEYLEKTTLQTPPEGDTKSEEDLDSLQVEMEKEQEIDGIVAVTLHTRCLSKLAIPMEMKRVEVRPGKPFIHAPNNGRRLHISQATLGTGSSTKNSVVQCNVGNSSPVFLCSLFPEKTEISQLHLEFEETVEVVFSVIGPRSIHLTGYYLGGRCGQHFHPDDETESYGEDIADTETERSANGSDEDEYEDSFINDDEDPEIMSPSTVYSSEVKVNPVASQPSTVHFLFVLHVMLVNASCS